MLELINFYHNNNQYVVILNIKKFVNELHTSVLGNKCIKEVVKFTDIQNRGIDDYLEQFNYDCLIECQELFSKIRQYLEINKFKMDTARKIEIFQRWFYWLSISNLNAWIIYNRYLSKQQKSIDINNYSFENLHQFAKGILYEVDSISCCYNQRYVLEHYKPNEMETLRIQPNILIRAICSQSVDNVKLLLDNGLDCESLKFYPFKLFKSILHYPFYCQSVEIFHLLLSNAFCIKDADVFYDVNEKKSFRFALYFHYLKENNFEILNSLEFDHSQFMISFKLYEKLQKDEILKLFESLFDIGFSIFLGDYFHTDNSTKDKTAFYFIQLLPCINQNGIKSYLIQYLIDKLTKYEKDSDRVQAELNSLLFNIIVLFHYNTFKLKRPKLQKNDLFEIFSSVFPNIHDYCLNEKKILDSCDFILFEFFDSIQYIKLAQLPSKSVYQIEYFKIIDLLLNYSLFSLNIIKEFFINLCSKALIYYFDSKIVIIAALTLYLLQNDFLDVNAINSLNQEIYEINANLLPEHAQSIQSLISLVCNSDSKSAKSLKHLSRKIIKKSLKCKCKNHLNLLNINIPTTLLPYIYETIKPSYDDFLAYKLSNI